MSGFKIVVPATSANIGSGFDCTGLALNLYNTVYIDTYDIVDNNVDIMSLDNVEVPTDEDNLIYRTIEQYFNYFGESVPGILIRQKNDIPIARGLGSSSACIVAGLLGANAILKDVCDRKKLLDMAAEIEGHPDNVAPAFLGGFSSSVISDKKVFSERFEVEESLRFFAFIPPHELETSVARSVIPRKIDHCDAVFNLSRSALLTAAFAKKDYSLLKIAVEDRLHQPYRIDMISGAKEIFKIADSLGSIGTFISGAGSSIMAIVSGDNESFMNEAERLILLNESTRDYIIKSLKVDNVGARIESCRTIPQKSIQK